jgi:hypothetical protein
MASMVIWTANIEAASPPDKPLPRCIDEHGAETGACPVVDPSLTGRVSGEFTAGGTVKIETVPTVPVCDYHRGYPPYPWTPSPCYSAVHPPQVVGCGVIDLLDGGTFKEMSCSRALYKDLFDMPSQPFTYVGKDGKAGCGDYGRYQTYVYGGAANVPGARWVERGPDELECNVTFNGSRPDGLYGPTWVKMRTGIDYAQNGDERRGSGRSSEFYVPIDGDMREGIVDVAVLVTADVTGSPGEQTVEITATVTNLGSEAADDVNFNITLPPELHFVSTSNPDCRYNSESGAFQGGGVICSFTLEAAGDSFGNDVQIVDAKARIINASDLKDRIEASARVADDVDASNNDDNAAVTPTFNSGSYGSTRAAMEALAPYFDYETTNFDKQCDVYMNEIFSRLEAIRDERPWLFDNLSYGRVTSGGYDVFNPKKKGTAGHVGVVVYEKGTNYHQTGIIIHGTPTWSPVDNDIESQQGTKGIGDHITTIEWTKNIFGFGTQGHGELYRTPDHRFPGYTTAELPLGCGFEGVYIDNGDEFERSANLKGCGVAARQGSCPVPPNAVIVRTESPVDLLLTNSRGERIEATGDEIVEQGMDNSLNTYAIPHADGSFGWFMVLPEDNYDIRLTGNANGPFKLTTVAFDDNGKPHIKEYEETTTIGETHAYRVIVPQGLCFPLVPPDGGVPVMICL